MKLAGSGDGMNMGSVVTCDGRVGVVVNAWPLEGPRGVVVHWEPLLANETTTYEPVPDKLKVVPLR